MLLPLKVRVHLWLAWWDGWMARISRVCPISGQRHCSQVCPHLGTIRGPLGPDFEQNWVPMALGSSAMVACAHLVFNHFNPLVYQFYIHIGSCSASSSAEGTLLRTQRVGQFFSITIRLDFKDPWSWKWANEVDGISHCCQGGGVDSIASVLHQEGVHQQILPCRQGRIDSVKINPSLLMMRECRLPIHE